ncbi:SDR family oxidoreductase [Pseudonocardia sp. MH-G8]|uniref:SDR family oxidoreductase n=1 Tax=Pseudonocardia sp. MH-G8 TaxID=1854588 RepID=UPI000BA0A3A6|nr:SDR family oxidoreductase [Pseudonocardia sp. MH-G8]OZM79696.1 3-oxoacyl-ACP reductase [Pseudonocardia sp. MH-G8]
MDTRFEGKAAIVTGASRGIGLAIAQRIVDEGGRVCLTARKQEPLDQAVAALGPERAIAVAGKGDDAEHQESAVEATLAAFGRIDCLVNNAGINPVYGRLIDLDLAAARKIVEVNCLGALSWTQRAYHGWMAEHGGSVVNVASVAGLGSSPGIGFYGASKAMLINMTRQLAVELGPVVRVNAVAPAVVKTDFAMALYAEGEEKAARAYPLKRLGEPADIGSAVAFLLSADASWMTGELVVLDGGVTLTRER